MKKTFAAYQSIAITIIILGPIFGAVARIWASRAGRIRQRLRQSIRKKRLSNYLNCIERDRMTGAHRDRGRAQDAGQSADRVMRLSKKAPPKWLPTSWKAERSII
jgi:hypothetical protein